MQQWQVVIIGTYMKFILRLLTYLPMVPSPDLFWGHPVYCIDTAQLHLYDAIQHKDHSQTLVRELRGLMQKGGPFLPFSRGALKKIPQIFQ